ncbi:MAG TPA: hypothetical protein VF857_09950 [Spirochaetota bacterium]
MKKLLMITCLISSALLLISWLPASAEDSDQKKKNLVDDTYVTVGAGLVTHFFTKQDDFRKGSISGFNGSDDVNFATGVQANADFNVNKFLELNLPVGVNPGYRFQYIGVTREYTATSLYSNASTKLKQKFNYFNHIGYVDFLFPIGSSKYLVLGAEAGCGLSTFKYTVSGTGISEKKDSVNGIVIPLGLFLDWGADDFGGRIGYDYMISKYSKLRGSKPSLDGHQLYVNLRYAF